MSRSMTRTTAARGTRAKSKGTFVRPGLTNAPLDRQVGWMGAPVIARVEAIR
jgi:hypothetical protein